MIPCVIAIEGISGAGKTTQLHHLTRRFSGIRRVIAVDEFSDTATGRILRTSFLERTSRFVRMHAGPRYGDQTHLVLLADIIAKASAIDLAEGDLAIVDRYCDSWLCYTLQSSDRTILTDELVRTLYDRFRESFNGPNVKTVYLRIPPDEAARRLAIRDGRADVAAEKQQLSRIAAMFDCVCNRSDVLQIDALQAETAITNRIVEAMGL